MLYFGDLYILDIRLFICYFMINDLCIWYVFGSLYCLDMCMFFMIMILCIWYGSMDIHELWLFGVISMI